MKNFNLIIVEKGFFFYHTINGVGIYILIEPKLNEIWEKVIELSCSVGKNLLFKNNST